MFFEQDLIELKYQIDNAQDIDELNFIRLTKEKKYWWTSILVVGLFYALNGDVGKMIISWILSFFTLGIYGLYTMYTSYRDQNEFNTQMEYLILQRTKELKGNAGTASNNASVTFKCPECGEELNETIKFCPVCGKNAVAPPVQVVYCSKCGEKIVDNAKFCPKCGNQIQN